VTRVEVAIRESELPEEAIPMARIELSTGVPVELTLDEWAELAAKLEIGVRTRAGRP
jgi:hypothetical protein